jgi:hypothetical protein
MEKKGQLDIRRYRNGTSTDPFFIHDEINFK